MSLEPTDAQLRILTEQLREAWRRDTPDFGAMVAWGLVRELVLGAAATTCEGAPGEPAMTDKECGAALRAMQGSSWPDGRAEHFAHPCGCSMRVCGAHAPGTRAAVADHVASTSLIWTP